MRPVYYNEIEPFAADWLVGNKGVRMTDDIYRDGPDSAIDAFCTRPAVDRPPPPTISQCFDGLKYEDLGQIVQNIKLLGPQLLDGDADALGRWICITAWTHHPNNPPLLDGTSPPESHKPQRGTKRR